MGNTIYVPSSQVDVKSVLNEFSFIKYQGDLSNGKFIKSAHCITDNGQVVVKIYARPDKTIDITEYQEKLRDICEQISFYEQCHLCPISKSFVSKDGSFGLMVRQFFYSNLSDRLNVHPYLTSMEKRWLAYQCIKAVDQLHSLGLCHGDIKCENFVVTSWGWVMLTDFGYYKPTCLVEDDNIFSRFSYFFQTQRRDLCYLAPERVIKKGNTLRPMNDSISKSLDEPIIASSLPDDSIKEVGSTGDLAAEDVTADTPALDSTPLQEDQTSSPVIQPNERRLLYTMDIFSLGCVLFELFTESQHLFDLSSLIKYRDGNVDVSNSIHKLNDPLLEEMIFSMISVNPNDRLTAREYLEKYTGDDKIFPTAFSTIYHPLFLEAYHDTKLLGDYKILSVIKQLPTLLREFIPSEDESVISSFENLGKELEKTLKYVYQGISVQKDYNSITDVINTNMDQINSLDSNTINRELNALKEKVMAIQHRTFEESPNTDSLFTKPATPAASAEKTVVSTHFSDHSLLLLLDLITTSMRETLLYYSQYAAVLVLTELAKYFDENIIIQRIIPFITNFLAIKTPSTILSVCIHSIATIFNYIHTLPDTDLGLFKDYLWPKFYALLNNDLPSSVYMSILECLPSILINGKRLFDLSFIIKKNAIQKQKEETNNQSTEGTYDVQYFDIQKSIIQFLIDLLSENKSITCVKMAVFNVIPEIAPIFSTDILDYFIPDIFSCFNSKDVLLRSACIQFIPRIFSQVSTPTFQGAISHYLIESLLDDNEMILYHILRTIQFLAQYKVFNQTDIVDIVKKINCLLFYPRQYIVKTALDTIFSLDQCLPAPEIQILLKDYLTIFFSVPFLSIPWKKEYFEICLHPPITLDDYKKLYGSICRNEQFKITEADFSAFYENDPSIDVKKNIISFYITQSRAKYYNSNDKKDVPVCKSRKNSVLTENHTLTADPAKKEPMASINTGTSDHIISVSVPTSQKGSSTECTVGEVYNAEELRAKYGLDAVVRTNDTPESKHIDFDTMTLEDFTETKRCIALTVPPCPPSLGPLVDESGKPTTETMKSRENNCILIRNTTAVVRFDFKGSLLYSSVPDRSPLHKICVSDDRSFFLTYSDNNSIYLYDTKTIGSNAFNYIGQYNCSSQLQDVSICDSSHSFVAVTKDSRLILIRADNLINNKTPVMFDEKISSLAMATVTHYNTPLSSNILYTTTNGNIYIFDIRSNHHYCCTQNNPQIGTVTAMTMCANNYMAALGYSNGLLSFYDLRLPSLFKLCEHPFGQSIDRLYSSPSSNSNMCDYLWCLTGENNADCWNIEENKLVKRLAVDSTRQSQDPADMLVHHDLPHFFASSAPEYTVFPKRSPYRFTSLFSHSYSLAEANYFLTSGTDCTVRYWSSENSRTLVPTATPGVQHSYTTAGNVTTARSESILNDISKSADRMSLPSVHQHHDAIEDVCVLAGPQHVMLTASADGSLKVWN